MEWYTHPDNIDQYRKDLFYKITYSYENLNMNYDSIMIMPVKRWEDLIKWKVSLEKEKERIISEGKNSKLK